MRIIVTGGGTGGHLFPGIAFATGMQQRFPGCRVLFIGTMRLLDQQTLSDYDFEVDSIKCMGLKGVGLKNSIQSILQLPIALFEARRIIKRFMPDLVLGVGGYVTGPVLLAARLSGVPLCIHEQNSVPGLANKILSKIVNRIFLSLPCEYPFPVKKTVMSGNPVRHELIDIEAKRDEKSKKEKTILVLGGSQGAHRVNILMTEAVELLFNELGDKLQVIHQTGTADEEQVRIRYELVGINADVQPFFQKMADQYSRADLVISRAGATTLAELSAIGLPALLIPYPYAADDHQKVNALYYQDGGGARMFPENELNGEKLAMVIRDLLTNPAQLDQMARNMKGMGKPEATQTIINECLSLIDMKRVKAEA